MSTTDRWLTELQGKAQAARTELERGEFLLRASSAVANLHHDNVADIIRLILDSGTWREYTYPNGDHFVFRAREFDYFLAQQDIDPRIVADAAVYTGDQELRALLVESSLDKPGDDRRDVDEITATYPGLAPWLEKFKLRSLGPAVAYNKPQALRNLAEGKSTSAHEGKVRWGVVSVDREALPGDIARRLMSNPDLLQEVVAALAARRSDFSVTLSVTVNTCERCGAEFTPQRDTSRYCGAACRNAALRQRRKASA